MPTWTRLLIESMNLFPTQTITRTNLNTSIKDTYMMINDSIIVCRHAPSYQVSWQHDKAPHVHYSGQSNIKQSNTRQLRYLRKPDSQCQCQCQCPCMGDIPRDSSCTPAITDPTPLQTPRFPHSSSVTCLRPSSIVANRTSPDCPLMTIALAEDT